MRQLLPFTTVVSRPKQTFKGSKKGWLKGRALLAPRRACRVLGLPGLLPGAAGCCQAETMWGHFRVLPGAAGCCRVAGVAGVAGLLTVLLGRDCVFFRVKFQYVRVFEHCRVRQAARRVGGGGSNLEPHAVLPEVREFIFQTSLNFVVKMLLQPPEMKFNKEKKR